jgi:RNA polymerase sigma-70 factor (ECF subfamily)
LDRFLAGLKPETRKLFLRRYWYASPIRDIARDYGMSVSKVKTSLFRTREKLRVFLEQEGITL